MKIVKHFGVLIAGMVLVIVAGCSRTDEGPFDQEITGRTLSARVKVDEQGLAILLVNIGNRAATISPLMLSVKYVNGRTIERTCAITRVSAEQVSFTCAGTSGAAIISQVNSAALHARLQGGAKLFGKEQVVIRPMPTFDSEAKNNSAISSVNISLPWQKFAIGGW
ncbi:MAG: hypothetical protein PHC61_05300 [Chitinivibrionales bacterium]|nr:hypothetical protein [Chitinivibrionales bacterium]